MIKANEKTTMGDINVVCQNLSKIVQNEAMKAPNGLPNAHLRASIGQEDPQGVQEPQFELIFGSCEGPWNPKGATGSSKARHGEPEEPQMLPR